MPPIENPWESNLNENCRLIFNSIISKKQKESEENDDYGLTDRSLSFSISIVTMVLENIDIVIIKAASLDRLFDLLVTGFHTLHSISPSLFDHCPRFLDILKSNDCEKILRRSDSLFRDTFFSTFRNFTNTHNLMEALISRLKRPESIFSIAVDTDKYEHMRSVIRKKTSEILEHWIISSHEDFHDDINLPNLFFSSLVVQTPLSITSDLDNCETDIEDSGIFCAKCFLYVRAYSRDKKN